MIAISLLDSEVLDAQLIWNKPIGGGSCERVVMCHYYTSNYGKCITNNMYLNLILEMY